MVLIRYGTDGVTKTVKSNSLKSKDKITFIYYEDSVWSIPRDANLRAEQLKDAGQFTLITWKRYTNAPDEYTVWSSRAKHRGNRYVKKREKRERHKEMVEGTCKDGVTTNKRKFCSFSKPKNPK